MRLATGAGWEAVSAHTPVTPQVRGQDSKTGAQGPLLDPGHCWPLHGPSSTSSPDSDPRCTIWPGEPPPQECSSRLPRGRGARLGPQSPPQGFHQLISPGATCLCSLQSWRNLMPSCEPTRQSTHSRTWAACQPACRRSPPPKPKPRASAQQSRWVPLWHCSPGRAPGPTPAPVTTRHRAKVQWPSPLLPTAQLWLGQGSTDSGAFSSHCFQYLSPDPRWC